MFTGIVETTGKIKAIRPIGYGKRAYIESKKNLEDINIGDSIAVNGVCLTAVELDNLVFGVDISFETLKRSNLGFLKEGDIVNLERALRLTDRLSGHIVLGHVDGIGKVISVQRVGEFFLLKVAIEERLMRYCVEKGSVAVDGISLTISALEERMFEVAVIPHTFENTNLSARKPGDYVNVEVDILGKYVERLLNKKDGVTLDLLKENGFI